MRPRVVMKFGGTSVGDGAAMARTAAHILNERGQRLVVVSAVGGVTDVLLKAATASLRREDVGPSLEQIRARHKAIIDAEGLPSDVLSELEEDLGEVLAGVSKLGELTPRTRDWIQSFGERMSSRLLAEMLCRRGAKARAYDAGELGFETDSNHGNAEPSPASMEAIGSAWDGLDGEVIPVVTGFLGRTAAGDVTTLGRGGSDFSAALFAAATDAEEIQIWTDVSGFLEADPGVVIEASVIPSMLFEEAAELAYFGARVLHPRTIEPARLKGIPVRVLGTFDEDPEAKVEGSDDRGTLISDDAPPVPIRAIAMREDVQSLHIHSLRMLDAPGFLVRVFEVFARHKISVDVIATSEVSVSMTFNSSGAGLQAAIDEISSFAKVESSPPRALLCLVGSGLREDPSLLARVFGVFAEWAIPIHVISQGASRINVNLVTDSSMAHVALQALYAELFADQP